MQLWLVSSIASRPKRSLLADIPALAGIGKLYELPVAHSTVDVDAGRNQPTTHPITEVLAGAEPTDRAWKWKLL